MSTTRVKIKAGGPLSLEGEFELIGPDGTRIEPPVAGRALLCRCGESSLGVLCDGSHNRTDFEGDLRRALAERKGG